MTAPPFNPLDKISLGQSVAEALLRTPVAPLIETENLIGAGVYAIYYTGSFEAYAPLARKNRDGKFEQPIYVGKAVPKGARKGGLGLEAATGRALRDRLGQHATSIDQVQNIELTDFYYRSLVVDDIWIPLGENMLIEKFAPIWNILIDGFGNKDPGQRRATQHRSLWDVLHPGRAFAEKLGLGDTTAADVSQHVRKFFSGEQVSLVPIEQASDPDEGFSSY